MELEDLLVDFFDDDDVERLVRDAGKALGCPMILVNNAFRVEAHYSPEGFHDQLFASLVKEGELNYELIGLAELDRAGKSEGGLVQVRGSENQGRVLDLAHRGVSMGYLVCVDVDGRLEAAEEREIELICAVLAKQMLFKYHRDQLIMNDGQAVLTGLLEGEYKSETAFQLQASATFLAGFRPERMAVIDVGEYIYEGGYGDMLGEEFDRLFSEGHQMVYKKRVLVFLKEREISGLRAVSQRYSLWAAVTSKLSGLYSLPEAYDSALRLLEQAVAHGGERVSLVDEHRGFLMVDRLSCGESLIDPGVAHLMDMDMAKGTDYVRTLFHYLDCHRSVKAACQRLRAHRNTVIYRIGRIKEELGTDLEAEEGAFTLLVSAAVALHKMDPSWY